MTIFFLIISPIIVLCYVEMPASILIAIGSWAIMLITFKGFYDDNGKFCG